MVDRNQPLYWLNNTKGSSSLIQQTFNVKGEHLTTVRLVRVGRRGMIWNVYAVHGDQIIRGGFHRKKQAQDWAMGWVVEVQLGSTDG